MNPRHQPWLWLLGLVAPVTIVVVARTSLHEPFASVMPAYPAVVRDDLQPGDLGLPLPPGSTAVGRITSTSSTTGRSLIARLEAPLSLEEASRWGARHWSGARRAPGSAVVFERRTARRLEVIHLDADGPRTRLAVTIEESPR